MLRKSASVFAICSRVLFTWEPRSSGRPGCASYPGWVAKPAWPEPVQRVTAYLQEAGAEVRVEEFPDGTPTAQAAARAVGCELAQIVKSLVFDCDGRPVVVMVPGDRRADSEKIASAAGTSFARIAGVEEVEDATGFEPGAVAPFPLPKIERLFIDRTLLGHRLVWIGAGSERHMAALSPAELVRLSRARPMDVVAAHT
jgi:prolyl-tRNA editing enzyme YbaK/EbsC (Cys-tRNA(Pro) deacylase)